ncbi:ell-associated factor Eaf [Hordeum vulgare]|nr:ell-associated factor Eaf [Hordeum vulgare]
MTGPRNSNRSSTYQPVTADPFSSSPDPNDQDENLDILGDDDNGSPNNMASAQGTYRGFDINLPNQLDMDDEVADVDVNDEAVEGLNAAEALRAQVNAEGQQAEQATSSSSGSSSGSGSGSGSSTSGSDDSDGDSPSSGGDVDI